MYTLDIDMGADQQALGEVVITGMAMKNTEEAMTEAAKNSQVVVNNVSAQEIKRTQDNNAGEVIRRIPGVSLIEDKFVMLRGLSQRYNNVWINGGAVPSSEPDSRAFSFDIIPSSQIDNMMIVKSPAAEYPADFTGGFIQVNTKDIPPTNRFSVSAGGNWNRTYGKRPEQQLEGKDPTASRRLEVGCRLELPMDAQRHEHGYGRRRELHQ